MTAESSCAPWKIFLPSVFEPPDICRHLAREVCTPVSVQNEVARVEMEFFSYKNRNYYFLRSIKPFAPKPFFVFGL